ncbi:hypothetical protein JTB14_018212 [Gonioctena quinquepunctata]|nr:hypothetical protein JTB14_018212 [Gonioctena quinquepunctata]
MSWLRFHYDMKINSRVHIERGSFASLLREASLVFGSGSVEVPRAHFASPEDASPRASICRFLVRAQKGLSTSSQYA